jgi:3-methyladenine DNA glycosylase AlkD
MDAISLFAGLREFHPANAPLYENRESVSAVPVCRLSGPIIAFAIWASGDVAAPLIVSPPRPSLRPISWMGRSASEWMMAKDRWAARAGWNLTASRVNKGADGLDLPALLDRIEKEMPKAMPEVPWTMNNTLGAIGIHDPKLRKRAIAIGEKIGLYRDWPASKGCIPRICRCGSTPW